MEALEMEAKTLERVFIYKKSGKELELADPSPLLSKEKVLSYWADTYPELNNATVQGPEIVNDQLRYTFVSIMGTKG